MYPTLTLLFLLNLFSMYAIAIEKCNNCGAEKVWIESSGMEICTNCDVAGASENNSKTPQTFDSMFNQLAANLVTKNDYLTYEMECLPALGSLDLEDPQEWFVNFISGIDEQIMAILKKRSKKKPKHFKAQDEFCIRVMQCFKNTEIDSYQITKSHSLCHLSAFDIHTDQDNQLRWLGPKIVTILNNRIDVFFIILDQYNIPLYMGYIPDYDGHYLRLNLFYYSYKVPPEWIGYALNLTLTELAACANIHPLKIQIYSKPRSTPLSQLIQSDKPQKQ